MTRDELLEYKYIIFIILSSLNLEQLEGQYFN